MNLVQKSNEYFYRCDSGRCVGQRNELKGCGDSYPCFDEPSTGCGIRLPELWAKVVGGRNADLHEWPWQVMLFKK